MRGPCHASGIKSTKAARSNVVQMQDLHENQGGTIEILDAPVLAVPATEDHILRRSGGEHAVLPLRVGHVVHGFGEELVEPKIIAQGRPVEMGLLEPAEALAMRAVRHVTRHVAALGPTDHHVDLVKQIVGTGKFTNGLGDGMHDDVVERLHSRQRLPWRRRDTLDLQEARRMIPELGEVRLILAAVATVSGQSVLPVRCAAAAGQAIQRAVVVKQL